MQTTQDIITGDPSDKICWKCESENIVKNGFRSFMELKEEKKLQLYKCRDCGYIFDEKNSISSKEKKKAFAFTAYRDGLSLVRISRIVGVSRQTISRWLKPDLDDETISLHAVNESKMTKEKEDHFYNAYEAYLEQ